MTTYVTTSGHHLGHVKSKPDSRDTNFSAFFPALKKKGLLPPLPDKPFGHGNDFLGELWKMLGNGPSEGSQDVSPKNRAAVQGAGDCEIAGKYHEAMADAANTGSVVPKVSGERALKTYSSVKQTEQGGEAYDLVSGDGDTGLETRTVLKYGQKQGFPDNDGNALMIGDYGFVKPKDVEQLWYTIWLTERAGIAIEFPESADQQFANGEPWDVVKGAPIVGGHYIFGTGHPEKGSTSPIAFITWAKRTLMTQAFFEKYNDEVTTYVSPRQFKKTTGKDYAGHDEGELEQYLHEVATEKSSLFR
jgi:hypothetical protein